MAISNYTELQAAVSNWLARADLIARAPEFIALAEAKFNRTIHTRFQESAVTIGSTDGAGAITLPADYQHMNYVRMNTGSLAPVEPMAIDIGMGLAIGGQVAGYTIIGNTIQLWPLQATSANIVRFQYRKVIPPLSGSVGFETNWLLTKHPDVYLYGSLMQAVAFVRDDPRVPLWTAGLEKSLSELARLEEVSRWQSSSMNMRVRGVNVRTRLASV